MNRPYVIKEGVLVSIMKSQYRKFVKNSWKSTATYIDSVY
ncbi:hypothetical protein Leryth_007574 [Lithospermum erythrorhizon]|nr:hypothetical protein Leryth_007574 [Lithospermum erythrorhizon]